MGQRSRKRRAERSAEGNGGAASGRPPAGNNRAAAPAPRSDVERGYAAAPAPRSDTERGYAAAAAPRSDMERGYARSRERADAVRASLDPLAPGERPTAVTVAAIVAALIGVANVVLVAAGAGVVERQNVVGGLIFGAIMLVAAVFMWRGRYWAVLGFQALLGLSVITGSLSLLVASNVEAVVRSLVVIAAAGTLFWFLIRAMARLQMPSRTR